MDIISFIAKSNAFGKTVEVGFADGKLTISNLTLADAQVAITVLAKCAAAAATESHVFSNTSAPATAPAEEKPATRKRRTEPTEEAKSEAKAEPEVKEAAPPPPAKADIHVVKNEEVPHTNGATNGSANGKDHKEPAKTDAAPTEVPAWIKGAKQISAIVDHLIDNEKIKNADEIWNRIAVFVPIHQPFTRVPDLEGRVRRIAESRL